MALDKQVVGVSFTRGLDTQTDKRLVLPGKMVALQNTTMQESDTFKRRNGTTALVTGSAINTIGSNGNQLVALDGTSLGSYSSTGGSLVTAGSVDDVTLAIAEAVRGLGSNDSYDCATSGGYTCYVWRHFTSGTITSAATVAVIDESTGAHVLRETSMRSSGNMRCPRVVAITGAFVILYYDSGTGTLYGRVVQTSAPGTLGGETSLRTDLSTNAWFIDACASGSTTFVCYASSDATNSTRAIAITVSGTTPSVSAGPVNITTQAQIADNKIGGLAIAIFSASLIGVYIAAMTTAGTPGMWAAVVTSAMAISQAAAVKDATAAPLRGANITAVLSGSTMFVYSDDVARGGEATATARLIRRTGLNSSNTITSAAVTIGNSMTRQDGTNGPFINAKAFVVGSSVYLPVHITETGSGTLQNSWFLLVDTGSAFRVAAHALVGTWGPPVTVDVGIPSALAFSATSIGVLTGQRTFLSFESGLPVSSTGAVRLSLDFTAPSLVKGQIGPVLEMANGMLSMFDGDLACESGFLLFPEVVTASSGGAGLVDAGTRSIIALYEWVDAAGQRHQSAPSVGITYTNGGATTINVVVPTLTMTQRASLNIAVYATKAAGSIYYRASTLSSPTANSTTASTVTFVYNITDATLGSGELLYTTGGILPNNAPPPCSALAIHQDRVFINPSDDPYTYQPSQPWVSGFGVQWNETLRGRVESTGGPVTAFASMDDKLIVFRPRKIGVLFGQGPATTGIGSTYQLQDLPTDVGCSEPRSVLVMPEGVIFKSTSKGWYRLGRDLNLQWIGEGVQAYDAQGVTSAVLLDTQKECRFTTNDANGQTLVYCYERKDEKGIGQWSTYSNYAARDAVWWSGGNAYVRATATKLIKELPPTAGGLAYGDEATAFTGGNGGTNPAPQTGTAIPLMFQTGWLKPGEALQAFQRIWRTLFTGKAAGHPLPQTTITRDYSTPSMTLTVASTAAFVADQALGLGLTAGLGTADYEAASDPYTILDAVTFELSVPFNLNHNTGETIRGTPVAGASGTLQVDFYFDGNSTAIGFTSTISDVSTLVNGDAWDVRFHMAIQKCDSVMMKVTSIPASTDPGASLDFSGMSLELGVKKGARKLPASKSG